MRGSFKTTAFDIPQLERFAKDLEKGGLDFDIEWRKNNKLLAPDDSSQIPNNIQFKYQGNRFFSQNAKMGNVNTTKLPKPYEELLAKTLIKHGMYSEPGLGLGVGLAALYLVIVWFAILPKAGEIGETFMLVVMALKGLMVIGLVLIYLASRSPDTSKGSLIFAYVVAAPGLISGSPSSLLCLPFLIACGRLSLYNALKQYQPSLQPV